MSKSKKIKNAIISLVQGIQYKNEPAFVNVMGTPRGEFDGYPAARVLPGDITTEKGAYSQNDRVVALTLRIHVPSTKEGTEFDTMYDLTDLVLDALDTADYEGEFISAVGVLEINASRGDWFDTDSPTGPILACDIAIEVTYSKDN